MLIRLAAPHACPGPDTHAGITHASVLTYLTTHIGLAQLCAAGHPAGGCSHAASFEGLRYGDAFKAALVVHCMYMYYAVQYSPHESCTNNGYCFRI